MSAQSCPNSVVFVWYQKIWYFSSLFIFFLLRFVMLQFTGITLFNVHRYKNKKWYLYLVCCLENNKACVRCHLKANIFNNDYFWIRFSIIAPSSTFMRSYKLALYLYLMFVLKTMNSDSILKHLSEAYSVISSKSQMFILCSKNIIDS